MFLINIFNYFHNLLFRMPAKCYDRVVMLRTYEDEDYRLGRVAIVKKKKFDNHLTAIDFSNGKTLTHLMIQDANGRYREIDLNSITSDFFFSTINYSFVDECDI